MTRARTNPIWARIARALSGMLLMSAGLTGMGLLFAAVYGRSDESRRAAYGLGLAGSLSASAPAQLLIIAGAVLVWQSLRGQPRPPG